MENRKEGGREGQEEREKTEGVRGREGKGKREREKE